MRCLLLSAFLCQPRKLRELTETLYKNSARGRQALRQCDRMWNRASDKAQTFHRAAWFSRKRDD